MAKPDQAPQGAGTERERRSDPFVSLVAAMKGLIAFHDADKTRHPPRLRKHLEQFLEHGQAFVQLSEELMKDPRER